MKYEIRTSTTKNIGDYAKIITIPKLASSDIYMNTFNMIFEVYYLDAWSEPLIEKYSIALKSNDVTFYKFQQLGDAEYNYNNGVGYVKNDNTYDIYVKSKKPDAYVYINIIGVSERDIAIIHDFAEFTSTEPAGITYPQIKNNGHNIIKDLEARLTKTNAKGLVSGSFYHEGSSVDLKLPENNRGYFGIVGNNSEEMAYIYINFSTYVITIKNIGTQTISATYDNTTGIISFSGLSSQKFLYYSLTMSS